MDVVATPYTNKWVEGCTIVYIFYTKQMICQTICFSVSDCCVLHLQKKMCVYSLVFLYADAELFLYVSSIWQFTCLLKFCRKHPFFLSERHFFPMLSYSNFITSSSPQLPPCGKVSLSRTADTEMSSCPPPPPPLLPFPHFTNWIMAVT